MQTRVSGEKSARRVPLAATTLEAAKAEMADLRRQKGGEGLPDTGLRSLFSDYADAYLKFHTAANSGKKPRTVAREGHSLVHWKKSIGNVRLDKITKPMVAGFVKARLEAGITPRTGNLDVIVLRNELNQALEEGLISRLPTEGLKPRKVWTPIRNLLTPAQFKELCEAAQKCGKNGQQRADYIRLLAYAFALSVVESGGLNATLVAREKAQAVKKNGVLELIAAKETLEDIGGLDQLKDWLLKRKEAFSPRARKYGLPMPKGLLILGIPGTGKSLTAKATAAVLGVPLLKLDAGRIFAGLVGQSESNLRSVIQTAEAIAPVVLWIDELEKGFSGSKSSGATDGGTSSRVFGSLISWLQEKTAPVFVVGTANDVSQLPPEMLRKGRWDELFFVDLPNREEREMIWNIQVAKHGRDIRHQQGQHPKARAARSQRPRTNRHRRGAVGYPRCVAKGRLG